MTELKRYEVSLTGSQLHMMLLGETAPPVKSLARSVDLSAIHEAIGSLSRNKGGGLDPETDASLAQVVHGSLMGLPRKVTLDSRFWQWLSCTEFRGYVRMRWAQDVDFEVDPTLTPSQQKRFLGNPGLAGLGRNALSRLFWSAEVMDDADEDYFLTKKLFLKQDLAVGVIEREFGLIPAVARACARELSPMSEHEHRAALRRLNLRASTVTLEASTEAEIIRLLQP